MQFSKYQAAGNDFILIDDRLCRFPVSDELFIQRLCSRRLGVGADGLILLQNSDVADFRMRIFNLDGKEASMCGNGLRCLALYLKDLGCFLTSFSVETGKGIFSVALQKKGIQTKFPPPKIFHESLQLEDFSSPLFVVDTGVPHAVCFTQDLGNVEVDSLGSFLRFHPYFAPDGVNVNFVEVSSEGRILVRTYERGVEGETLSCGTGMVASALAFCRKSSKKGFIEVIPKSSDILEVYIGEEVSLLGPASLVFQGVLV